MKKIFTTGLLALSLCASALGSSRQMEALDRGVLAVKTDGGVFVSWRFLGTDNKSTAFNVYRDGTLITPSPLTSKTNILDNGGTASSKYVIKAVNGGKETEASQPTNVWGQWYKSVQLRLPSDANGTGASYTPNDMSVGDVDGDGQYELIVKWDPNNSKDNSQKGKTGTVYLDCYKLDGTFLWRINLGKNIRAGAHYTQFQVYDYDGDGKAEVACKTAPGTIDGTGKYVLMGNDSKDFDGRNSDGYVLSGSEYLTMFNGETGAEMSTVAYNPARGTVKAWGDNYGNRVDRFLACTAYLDGEHPSLVVCRGYYTRSTLAAYDFRNGKLVQRWFHDSPTSGQGAYGEGFHNVSVADVDKDGYDEIIYGSATIDHDGKLYYRSGRGHGDAMHVSKMVAGDDDFYGWFVHEEKTSAYGYELRNLRTNKVVFGTKTGTDNGRGFAADVDPTNPGFEFASTADGYYYNKDGTQIGSRYSLNFRLYWDGDLQDEILDGQGTGAYIAKFNSSKGKQETILTLGDFDAGSSCNTTKATPCLSADILGDWREEVILYNANDPSKINIYTTTTPSDYRLVTPMHDYVYRLGVAWQNTAYNQPPHLSYYIGGGVDNIPMPDIYVVGGDFIQKEPTLTKQGAGGSSQNVEVGAEIESFNYAWENAKTVEVAWSPFPPDGISAEINNAMNTVVFSGASAYSGTYKYTITTVSNAADQATASGIFVVGDGEMPQAQLIKQGGGSSSQVVNSSNPFQQFNYQWKFAEDVEVVWGSEGKPDGIGVTVDKNEQKVYFNGTPKSCGNYTFCVSTVGGTKDSTRCGSITITSNTYRFVRVSADWNDMENWDSDVLPENCDTADITSGEVDINEDVRVYTKVENEGTLRIRTNVAFSEVGLNGGAIKSVSSNTPEFMVTINTLYADAKSMIHVGKTGENYMVIKGNMQGTGDIEKKGEGVLRIESKAEGYFGEWQVMQGTLEIGSALSIGRKGANVGRNATLNIKEGSTTDNITLADSAILNLDGDLTVNTAVFDGKMLEKGSYTSADYPQFITGSGTLVVLVGEDKSKTNALASDVAVIVYPNPTADIVSISGIDADEVVVTIYNVDGSVCAVEKANVANGVVKMGMKRFGVGEYVMKVENGDDVLVRKVVVK